MLRRYIEKDTITVVLPVSDTGIFVGLMRAGILFQVTNSMTDFTMPFNIRDWAWDYLQKYPAAIGLPKVARNRIKKIS